MTYNKANPPYKALTADPFTLTELDAHPDSARIWATIWEALKEGYTDGYDVGYDE